MIARATALRGALRERQDECEVSAVCTTLRDHLDAGLYRIMQPRRFGGYEFDLETFLRITVELSRGWPSSGWVFGLMATHNLIAGLFEEQAQVELFGDGDFRCPLSANLFIPKHRTVPSPNPSRPVVDFPGRGLHPNPMFHGSIGSLLISKPTAVSVGISQAAIDEYIENLTTKHQWGPMSPRRSELPVFHRQLGEATAYVDTAEAALHQVAQIWMGRARRSMETGEPVSDEDDRRLILV